VGDRNGWVTENKGEVVYVEGKTAVFGCGQLTDEPKWVGGEKSEGKGGNVKKDRWEIHRTRWGMAEMRGWKGGTGTL